MANSFYWVDSLANTRTLYIAGTSTTQFVLDGTEYGTGRMGEPYLEATPNRLSNTYRSWLYKPREYGFEALLVAATAAALETAMTNWDAYHDSELGEGYVKRITVGGTTRCLDCIPLPVEWENEGPTVAKGKQGYIAANPWWRSESATTVNGTIRPSVTIANSGFETGGTGDDFDGGAEVDDGTSDDFTDWTETNNDVAGNKCEATATAQAGTYAVMLTYVDGESAIQSGNLTVVPGETLLLSFYSRGDASVAGQYQIYDVTNSADIQAKATTGVTAASYAEVTKSFTAPADCVLLYVKFYSPSGAGSAYVDAVSLTRTSAFLSCANAGHIDAWPVITITGVVATPVLTNSDGDSITVSKTTTNADDTITIDCRPWGTYRRYVYFRENGTGTITPLQCSSGSRFIALPTGTNNLTLQATSGSPTIAVVYYLYYRSLY